MAWSVAPGSASARCVPGALRGREGLKGVLREVADTSVPPAFEVARGDGQLARDAAHEGRLARAVAAEEPDPGARLEGESDAREHRRAAVSEARVIDEDQGIRHLLRAGKGEPVRGVGVGGGDEGEPLELLQPASRLPGLARLRPEAGHERPNLARPALLLLVRGPLRREALASLALERGVPAAVCAGAAVLQVHDVGRGAVEEVPVVGDEEGRPLAADEPLLEPHHRVEIEVVGRLVEEKQVRAAHQGLREVEPDPPTAREVRDGAGEVLRVEPEPVENPPRSRLRGIAVDGLELRVRGRRGGGRRLAARPPRCRSAPRGAAGRRPSSSRGRSPDSPPSPGRGARWSSSAEPGHRPPREGAAREGGGRGSSCQPRSAPRRRPAGRRAR